MKSNKPFGAKNIFSQKVDTSQNLSNMPIYPEEKQGRVRQSGRNIFGQQILNINENMMIESESSEQGIRKNSGVQAKQSGANIFARREVLGQNIPTSGMSAAHIPNLVSRNIFSSGGITQIHQPNPAQFNPMNIFGNKNELKFSITNQLEDAEMNDGMTILNNEMMEDTNMNSNTINNNKPSNTSEINSNTVTNKDSKHEIADSKLNPSVQKDPKNLEEFEEIVRSLFDIPKFF